FKSLWGHQSSRHVSRFFRARWPSVGQMIRTPANRRIELGLGDGHVAHRRVDVRIPLPGGTSDKLGNRYEGRWTALAIFEVLRERAEAIRIEPPGLEGEGIEFYVRYSDHKHFHQVKRQRTGGDWTIAALRGAGVLKAFRERLADLTSHCTFA